MTKAALSPDFLWGFATASYQIEGAITKDGREPSIWDTFCDKPGKIADGSSGEIACDSYNQLDQDIDLLKQTGAKVYRFSLSWSRIIPCGGRHDPVNEKGLQYYVKLVDTLLENDIVPMITLFHWDLPDSLDRRYGGLLNKTEFVADFTHYARLMFKTMGSKVKHWITFNEPWCSSILGYNTGLFAPGHTSDRTKSPIGDSSREPWTVAHNFLVAHGSAVKVYRKEFKTRDGGEIGIALNGDWGEPWDASDKEDIEACTRKLEFSIGWFTDPIYFGRYPESMVCQLGDRLPKWTFEDLALVRGSNDFYGINHYCSHYVRHRNGTPEADDFLGNLKTSYANKEGKIIGPETQSVWLRPNPLGFRRLIAWISNRYGRPTIYVTENGTSIKGENNLPMKEILNDDFRLEYYRDYVNAMNDAVREDGVICKGYMAWSLMDNFEWAEGYETRFGVSYVDYKGGQKRYLKKSGKEIAKIFDGVIKKA